MAGERAAGGGKGKVLKGKGVLRGGGGVEMGREDDAVVKLWEGKQRRGCSLRSVRGKRRLQQGWGVMGVFGMRPGPAREIEAMGKGKSGDMAGGGRQGKESECVCLEQKGLKRRGSDHAWVASKTLRPSIPAQLIYLALGGWGINQAMFRDKMSFPDLVVGKQHSRLALSLTHQQPRTNP